MREGDGELLIDNLETGEQVACHTLSLEKGVVISNRAHYRDREQQVGDLEKSIGEHIGVENAQQLCALLKATSPKIYKDQLVGADGILGRHAQLPAVVIEHLLDRPRLSAVGLRSFLEAYAEHADRLDVPLLTHEPATANPDLNRYAALATQEAAHELH